MKKFSDFNIETSTKGFEGDKVKIARILNREIEVHDFKISDSKHFKEAGGGKCLQLQILINNEKHVVFTGSSCLIEAIGKVPQEEFPFATVIIEENDRYKFT